MTVVPSELGLTNTLSPSSPLYYTTRECPSPSSSLSPSTFQRMERPSSYSNNVSSEEQPYLVRKTNIASIHRQQNMAHPFHSQHQLPDRLQPLISGHENLANSDVMTKWVAEFLPKPEPPRFFRPLCARLSRQQQRLREEQAASARRCVARMDEVRTRLAMSVSEVRAEQKAMLRELRQKQRKRDGGLGQRKGDGESDGREPQQKRNETENGDGEQRQTEKKGTEEGKSGNDREQPQRNGAGAYDIFIHYISIRSNE